MVDLNLGPYVQDQMKQAETLQKQLETLLSQQYQYEVKSREDKKTLEYLNKSNHEDEIYRGVGTILVKVKDVESFKKEIEEDVEISEMRLKSIKEQVSQLNTKLKTITDEINKLYQKGNAKN
ncbi:MAG: prefoldin subunit beta [Thermoplasmatales archaeon]|nr:prefoldin subunit beta [Candidatus Thermoplasmatota archaeon]MCL6002543.1 prefoldin subunit beta [Candidatus Thermoplasmatota archaeon]MDA8054825.1 prefoldin subunit beta [Thermoplasmatales archaeon]